MFTDLFIKFLMWTEKHEELIKRLVVLVFSFFITYAILASIWVFAQLIWR